MNHGSPSRIMWINLVHIPWNGKATYIHAHPKRSRETRVEPIKTDSEAGCLCLYPACDAVVTERSSLNVCLADTTASPSTITVWGENSLQVAPERLSSRTSFSLKEEFLDTSDNLVRCVLHQNIIVFIQVLYANAMLMSKLNSLLEATRISDKKDTSDVSIVLTKLSELSIHRKWWHCMYLEHFTCQDGTCWRWTGNGTRINLPGKIL